MKRQMLLVATFYALYRATTTAVTEFRFDERITALAFVQIEDPNAVWGNAPAYYDAGEFATGRCYFWMLERVTIPRRVLGRKEKGLFPEVQQMRGGRSLAEASR